MLPGHQHFDERIINQSFLLQHLEHMSTEQFPQGLQIHLRHHKKIAALKEKAISHQDVKVGMPSGIITEALNSYDNTWYPGFITKSEPKEFRQTFYSTLAELAQQFAVIEKEFAQDFRDGANILPVRNRVKNRFLEVVAKLDHVLVMA